MIAVTGPSRKGLWIWTKQQLIMEARMGSFENQETEKNFTHMNNL